MLVRRLIFGLLLVVLLSMAWSMYRKAGDAARQREVLRAIPVRITNLNLPLSHAWEADLKLPGDAAVLRPLGLPDKTLGPQPDGTEVTLLESGQVEVALKLTGIDKMAARLTWIPMVDLQAQPPVTRIHEWRCLSDNLPEVAQLLPMCRFVSATEFNAEVSRHLVRLEQAARTVRPPAAAEPESNSATASNPVPASNSVPASRPSLTPEEVEKALRSGQSLEQALALKRGTVAPGQASAPAVPGSGNVPGSVGENVPPSGPAGSPFSRER